MSKLSILSESSTNTKADIQYQSIKMGFLGLYLGYPLHIQYIVAYEILLHAPHAALENAPSRTTDEKKRSSSVTRFLNVASDNLIL